MAEEVKEAVKETVKEEGTFKMKKKKPRKLTKKDKPIKATPNNPLTTIPPDPTITGTIFISELPIGLCKESSSTFCSSIFVIINQITKSTTFATIKQKSYNIAQKCYNNKVGHRNCDCNKNGRHIWL